MARKAFGKTPIASYLTDTPTATYDATGPGSAVMSSNTTSWSHTMSSGDSGVVVVSIAANLNNVASYVDFTRIVTFGGQTMRSLGAIDAGITYGDDDGFVELFYLLNPPSGVQTVDVSVNRTGTTLLSLVCNSVSYTGVGSVSNPVLNSFDTVTPSISVPSLSNGRCIVAMCSGSSISAPTQTQRYLNNNSAAGGAGNLIIQDAAGTGSNVTFGCASNGDIWGGIAVCLNGVGTVPAGVSGCWITLIGAGGGGGSGRKGNTFVNAYGGEGGQGGGVIYERYVPVGVLGSTYSVTVSSSGGSAGTSVTANNTNGNPGVAGGGTIFTSGSVTYTVNGGNGGQGGGTTAQSGTGYVGQSGYVKGEYWGSPGSVGSSGSSSNGLDGDTYRNGGTGGSGGGGVSSAGAEGSAGYGGDAWTTVAAGGQGGVANGSVNGNNGSSALAGFVSSAGGGGAGNTGGAAGTGGNGIGYGAGGGGGGASNNSYNSGSGGHGGPGYARIIWDYRGRRKKLGSSPVVSYSGSTNTTGISVPSGVAGAWIYMIGAGGAGGGGAKGNNGSSTYYGGQGGYGGNVTHRFVDASLLGSTYSVFIPSNRIGGSGATVNNTAGTSGQASDYSTFISGSFTLSCDSGTPGAGGKVNSQTAWPDSPNDLSGFRGTQKGGSGVPSGFGDGVGGLHGGLPASASKNTYATRDFGGGAGGGAGGPYIGGFGYYDGSPGGYTRSWGGTGGVAGLASGQSPGSGGSSVSGIPGGAAGGGTGKTGAAAQDGASATAYGAGGGGGGMSDTTTGKGGNGGPGYTRIIWLYE